jgi:hypothetical protein
MGIQDRKLAQQLAKEKRVRESKEEAFEGPDKLRGESRKRGETKIGEPERLRRKGEAVAQRSVADKVTPGKEDKPSSASKWINRLRTPPEEFANQALITVLKSNLNGLTLTEAYTQAIRVLSSKPDMVGEGFGVSSSVISNPDFTDALFRWLKTYAGSFGINVSGTEVKPEGKGWWEFWKKEGADDITDEVLQFME